MGKRTKFQQTDYAQLLLIAKSKLLENEIAATKPSDGISANQTRFMKSKLKDDDEEEKSAGGWQHAEWEVGRRLVGEVEGENTGEEAAVREVMLDSMDGGPEENILYEGGPKFTEVVENSSSDLHPIDQVIILSLCLDVSNSNPMVI
jgi:hypothetical protein